MGIESKQVLMAKLTQSASRLKNVRDAAKTLARELEPDITEPKPINNDSLRSRQ